VIVILYYIKIYIKFNFLYIIADYFFLLLIELIDLRELHSSMFSNFRKKKINKKKGRKREKERERERERERDEKKRETE